MTLFDRPIGPEAYAVIRFGLGYPTLGAPVDAQGILDRLNGPDLVAERIPTLAFADTLRDAATLRAEQKKLKKMGGDKADLKAARNAIRIAYRSALLTDLDRAARSDDPFRERLQWFWANHFTAQSKSRYLQSGHAGYEAEAIRPHVAGRFADLLKSAVTHPFMLVYLDQTSSVGPNSPRGVKSGRGLNENLAREVLELHTLGVGAAYSQTDVTEFAELLTGLSFNYRKGAFFDAERAEPGQETVLGHGYGDDGPADLADIHAALDDLALRPETARFLSFKLARYFVADAPDADLVAHMVAAYQRSDGHLADVYAAMLEHPAAWRDFGAKVKWPFELVASSFRAVGMGRDQIEAQSAQRVLKHVQLGLQQMGQRYQSAPGPDGWPDEARAWVHPHGLAARISWGMELARRFPGGAPNPRQFVRDALGDAAGSRLIWAAGVAESRDEGVGVVLASAEFNRR